jgi:hypothetical protein
LRDLPGCGEMAGCWFGKQLLAAIKAIYSWFDLGVLGIGAAGRTALMISRSLGVWLGSREMAVVKVAGGCAALGLVWRRACLGVAFALFWLG